MGKKYDELEDKIKTRIRELEKHWWYCSSEERPVWAKALRELKTLIGEPLYVMDDTNSID